MKSENIFTKHRIKSTQRRKAVLEIFLKNKRALSHSEIQGFLSQKMDRVTLYRILDVFEKNGLLHRVPDDEVAVKYALCEHGHELDHAHSDNHPHFKCASCGDTQCLEDVEIPTFKIPKTYLVQDQFVLLSGLCANCR